MHKKKCIQSEYIFIHFNLRLISELKTNRGLQHPSQEIF